MGITMTMNEGSDDGDDADAAVSPGELELCSDGFDNDCDGSTDGSDATGQNTWYVDSDGDSHGGSASISSCVAGAARPQDLPLGICRQPSQSVCQMVCQIPILTTFAMVDGNPPSL